MHQDRPNLVITGARLHKTMQVKDLSVNEATRWLIEEHRKAYTTGEQEDIYYQASAYAHKVASHYRPESLSYDEAYEWLLDWLLKPVLDWYAGKNGLPSPRMAYIVHAIRPDVKLHRYAMQRKNRDRGEMPLDFDGQISLGETDGKSMEDLLELIPDETSRRLARALVDGVTREEAPKALGMTARDVRAHLRALKDWLQSGEYIPPPRKKTSNNMREYHIVDAEGNVLMICNSAKALCAELHCHPSDITWARKRLARHGGKYLVIKSHYVLCPPRPPSKRRHADRHQLAYTPIEGEEWRPVIGYEDKYEVSNFGRVRSLVAQMGRRRAVPTILRTHTDRRTGLMSVGLSRNGTVRQGYLRKLMREAWPEIELEKKEERTNE